MKRYSNVTLRFADWEAEVIEFASKVNGITVNAQRTKILKEWARRNKHILKERKDI